MVIDSLGTLNTKKTHCIHLRLNITGYFKIVFKETTIAIFWACIVKNVSLSKEFESILTLLKNKEVLKIYVKVSRKNKHQDLKIVFFFFNNVLFPL